MYGRERHVRGGERVRETCTHENKQIKHQYRTTLFMEIHRRRFGLLNLERLLDRRGEKKKKKETKKKKNNNNIDGADPRTNVSRGFRDSQNIRANLFFEFDLMDADGSAARALYRNWVESIESESEMVNKKERCTGYLYYHHTPARDPSRTQKQQRLPFPLKWNRGSQVEKRVHFLSALTLTLFFIYNYISYRHFIFYC